MHICNRTQPRLFSYVYHICNYQFSVPLSFLSSAVVFVLYRLSVAAVLWFVLFVLKNNRFYLVLVIWPISQHLSLSSTDPLLPASHCSTGVNYLFMSFHGLPRKPDIPVSTYVDSLFHHSFSRECPGFPLFVVSILPCSPRGVRIYPSTGNSSNYVDDDERPGSGHIISGETMFSPLTFAA